MKRPVRITSFIRRMSAVKDLDHSGEADINFSEYVLLCALDLEKFRTNGNVAERARRSQQAVGKQINSLVERGYVIRVAGVKPDKRFCTMKLKPAGQKVIDCYQKRLEEII